MLGVPGGLDQKTLSRIIFSAGQDLLVAKLSLSDSYQVILSLNWRKWLKNRQNGSLGSPGSPTHFFTKRFKLSIRNFFGIKVFFSKINFKENFEAFSTAQTLEQRHKSGVKPYTRSAVNLDWDLAINPKSSSSATRQAGGSHYSHVCVILARPNENGKLFGLVNLSNVKGSK